MPEPQTQEVLDYFHFSMVSSFRFCHQTEREQAFFGRRISLNMCGLLLEITVLVTHFLGQLHPSRWWQELRCPLGSWRSMAKAELWMPFEMMRINEKSSGRDNNVHVNRKLWSRSCSLAKLHWTRKIRSIFFKKSGQGSSESWALCITVAPKILHFI